MIIKNFIFLLKLINTQIGNKSIDIRDNNFNDLVKKGYYKFKISQKETDKLAEELKKNFQKYNIIGIGDLRLHGLDRASSYVNEFFKENLKEHLKNINYSSSNKVSLFSVLGGKLVAGNNQSSGGGWHRDMYYEQYKILIYLSDVDENKGPFCYFEKSHKKYFQIINLILNFFSNNITRYNNLIPEILQKFNFGKKKLLVGSKGTCIVFNSSGLHRGIKIQNGERLSMTAYLYPKLENKQYLELENHFKIPNELKKQITS